MHFAFDEQQLEFRDQLRAFTDNECTPAQLREAWATAPGWSRRRWKALADLGVVGLTVPAEHGGLGLGLVDLVLLLEEAGRSGLPEPLLETTALAVPVLAAAPRLAERWLGPVAAGDAVVSVGLSSMAAVAGAEGADLILLESDGALHAVPADAVSLTPRPALDGARRLAQVVWQPTHETEALSAAEAGAALEALETRAVTGTAALLVGIAARLVSMGAAYAAERVQFGKPIGSFQAVKHLLADALVGVEFARPAVYRAAWSLDAGDPDAARHASMAKALASEAALGAARTALQVHGAIGYTWEHDLQLWMKRAWALAAAWGDAAEHRARFMDGLLRAT